MTIEELKERTKVTDSQLDTEIEETDMIVLADLFDIVDIYSEQLGLSPAEQIDVRIAQFVNGTKVAMDKALKLWRQHNPNAATYRALVEMLLRMVNIDVATKVCEFLARNSKFESSTTTLGEGSDNRPTLGGGAHSRHTLGRGTLDEGESGPPKKKRRQF